MRKPSPAVNDKKKASPRGKRKLQFIEKQAKLPLASKSIYLDIKDPRQTRKVETDLKKLGAVVEKFLSKDINYVISCQPRPKQQKDDKFGSADSPAAVSTPSPFNCGPSPGNVDPKAKQPSNITRGKAMVNKAKVEKKVSSIVENAEKWGVKVIPIENALKWIQKELLRLPPEKAVTKGQQSSSKSSSKVKRLKSPFLKFDAAIQHYKPVYKQLETWPFANVETAKGTCPFDGLTLGRGERSQEERGDRIGMVQLDVDSPVADANDCTRDSGTPFQDKSAQGKYKQSENNSSIVGGVKIVTAGDIRRRRERKRNLERKRGYCECCQLKYEDLDKHVRDDQHRAYIRDKSNYKQLDDMIQSGPNTAQFLQRLLVQHCTENKNKQRPSDTSGEEPKEEKNLEASKSPRKSLGSSSKENLIIKVKAIKARSEKKLIVQSMPEDKNSVKKLKNQVNRKEENINLNVDKKGEVLFNEIELPNSSTSRTGNLGKDGVNLQKRGDNSVEENKHIVPVRKRDIDLIIGENMSPRRVSWAVSLENFDNGNSEENSKEIKKNLLKHSPIKSVSGRQSPKKHVLVRESPRKSKVDPCLGFDRESNQSKISGDGNKDALEKLFRDKMEAARIPESPRRSKLKNKKNGLSTPEKIIVELPNERKSPRNRKMHETEKVKKVPTELFKPEIETVSSNLTKKTAIEKPDIKGISDKSVKEFANEKSLVKDIVITDSSMQHLSDPLSSQSLKLATKEIGLLPMTPRLKQQKESDVDNLEEYKVKQSPLFKKSPIQKKHKLAIRSPVKSPGNDLKNIPGKSEFEYKRRSTRSFRFDDLDDENHVTPTKTETFDSFANTPSSGISDTPQSNRRRKRWRVKSNDDTPQSKSDSGKRLKRLQRLKLPVNEKLVPDKGEGKSHAQNVDEKTLDTAQKDESQTNLLKKNLIERRSCKIEEKQSVNKDGGLLKLKGKLSTLKGSSNLSQDKLTNSNDVTEKEEFIFTTPTKGLQSVKSSIGSSSKKERVVSPPMDMYSRAKLRRSKQIKCSSINNTSPAIIIVNSLSGDQGRTLNKSTGSVGSAKVGNKKIEVKNKNLEAVETSAVGCDKSNILSNSIDSSKNVQKMTDVSSKTLQNKQKCSSDVGRNISKKVYTNLDLKSHRKCTDVRENDSRKKVSRKKDNGIQQKDKGVECSNNKKKIDARIQEMNPVEGEQDSGIGSCVRNDGIGSNKKHSDDKKNDSFTLRWQNVNISDSEKKARKIKLDRSWSLISDRSALKILGSEKDDEEDSFEGFHPDDVVEHELGSDVSFVETTEIEIDENSNHEWTIDDESQHSDNVEDVINYLPTMYSPGKDSNSNSSWGEACDDFIESHFTGFNKYSFKIGQSTKSPSRRTLGINATPSKRKVVEFDGDGTFETTPKKRKLGNNCHEYVMNGSEPGIQVVDDEITFNLCSPQKLASNATNFGRSPRREVIMSPSPFKMHTSTPFRVSPKTKCKSKQMFSNEDVLKNCVKLKNNSRHTRRIEQRQSAVNPENDHDNYELSVQKVQEKVQMSKRRRTK